MSSVPEHSTEANKALVVGGEPQVRWTVKSMLAEAGFQVTECDLGQDAFEVMQRNPCFDLLVTDTQPPGVDVWTLTHAFMSRCPLARAVLISEREDTAAINMESNGGWTVIPKADLADQFVDAIRNLGFGHRQRLILVAEDEPVIRNLVRLILAKAGYAVIDAADGQEALEVFRSYAGDIDLVISDLRMPRMSGVEFVEQIRLERPHIRVLLMSGHDFGMLREYAGCKGFLEKPFVPRQLTDKVAQLLNQPAPGETVS